MTYDLKTSYKEFQQAAQDAKERKRLVDMAHENKKPSRQLRLDASLLTMRKAYDTITGTMELMEQQAADLLFETENASEPPPPATIEPGKITMPQIPAGRSSRFTTYLMETLSTCYNVFLFTHGEIEIFQEKGQDPSQSQFHHQRQEAFDAICNLRGRIQSGLDEEMEKYEKTLSIEPRQTGGSSYSR